MSTTEGLPPLGQGAILMWLPEGETPHDPNFDLTSLNGPPYPNPEPWWLLSQAIISVMTADRKTDLLPWIKAGEAVFSPEQIRTIYRTMRAMGAA